MNYDMKQRDFRCFGAIWGQFVSTDSDQTEAALRKFTLGPLGSLNQVTKGLAKTIRAMADGTLDSQSGPGFATAWASCGRALRPRS